MPDALQVPRIEIRGYDNKTRLRGLRFGVPALFLLLLAATAHAAPAVVTPADAATLKRVIASHKGRVVMVNFWATWCIPCLEEFPALVKFARSHKGNGLDFIAVNGDSPRDMTKKVSPFLTRQKYQGRAFYIRTTDQDGFINAFDPKWQGEFPRTFIYNRQGKLVKTLTDTQTEKSLAKAVGPLL